MSLCPAMSLAQDPRNPLNQFNSASLLLAMSSAAQQPNPAVVIDDSSRPDTAPTAPTDPAARERSRSRDGSVQAVAGSPQPTVQTSASMAQDQEESEPEADPPVAKASPRPPALPFTVQRSPGLSGPSGHLYCRCIETGLDIKYSSQTYCEDCLLEQHRFSGAVPYTPCRCSFANCNRPHPLSALPSSSSGYDRVPVQAKAAPKPPPGPPPFVYNSVPMTPLPQRSNRATNRGADAEAPPYDRPVITVPGRSPVNPHVIDNAMQYTGIVQRGVQINCSCYNRERPCHCQNTMTIYTDNGSSLLVWVCEECGIGPNCLCGCAGCSTPPSPLIRHPQTGQSLMRRNSAGPRGRLPF